MSVGFRICDNKGFHITFENGWTVSVQFGHGNYCGSYPNNPDHDPDGGAYAPNAEIAAWDREGTWLQFPNEDSVKGWVTPSEVLKFMGEVASK